MGPGRRPLRQSEAGIQLVTGRIHGNSGGQVICHQLSRRAPVSPEIRGDRLSVTRIHRDRLSVTKLRPIALTEGVEQSEYCGLSIMRRFNFFRGVRAISSASVFVLAVAGCSEDEPSALWQVASIDQPAGEKLIGVKTSRQVSLISENEKGRAVVRELDWDGGPLRMGQEVVVGPILPWLSDDPADESVLWWDSVYSKDRGKILRSTFTERAGVGALETHELADFPPLGLAKARHGRNVAGVSGDRVDDRVVLQVSRDAGCTWSRPAPLADWRLGDECDYQAAISAGRVAVLSVSHTDGNRTRRLRLYQGRLDAEGVAKESSEVDLGDWSLIGSPMACLRINERGTYLALADPAVTVLQLGHDGSITQRTEIEAEALPVGLELVIDGYGTVVAGWIDARHAKIRGALGGWGIPRTDHRDVYVAVIEPGVVEVAAELLSEVGRRAKNLRLGVDASSCLAAWTSVPLDGEGKAIERSGQLHVGRRMSHR